MAFRADMDREASPDEVAGVAAAFADAGLDVDLEASVLRKSAGASLPWIIYLEIEFGIFVAAFVGAAGNALGEKATGAAWEGVRKLIDNIRAARRNRPDGALIIRDEHVHEEVVLTPNLPDDAIKALLKGEVRKTESSTLMWDPERAVWRDPLEH